jgi:hypothetical protein
LHELINPLAALGRTNIAEAIILEMASMNPADLYFATELAKLLDVQGKQKEALALARRLWLDKRHFPALRVYSAIALKIAYPSSGTVLNRMSYNRA